MWVWLFLAPFACRAPGPERAPDATTDTHADVTFPTPPTEPTDTADTADTATETAETAGPPTACDPASPPVASLSLSPGPVLLAVDAAVELTGPAPVVVACLSVDDPEDAVIAEVTEPAAAHLVRLHGLSPETAYTCTAAPVCDDLPAAPTAAAYTSPSLPPSVPVATTALDGELGTTGPPFALMAAWRYCAFDPQVFVAYDLDGTPRWVWEGVPGDVDGTLEVRYHGAGVIAWGGGLSRNGHTRLIDLDGATLYETAFAGSDGLVYHHDGKLLSDGTVLTLTESEDTAGGATWTGFAVQDHDPATGALRWSWTSQQAVDAGDLPPGAEVDAYHANWVDVVDGRLLVSLCKPSQVLAVDPATGEVAWTFGPGGDLTLLDPAGAPLGDNAWPQCQHGLELVGDELLVYDNGQQRQASRAAAYRVDEAASTATLTWTWDDEPWYEFALGDIDPLPGERVLVTQGHLECGVGTVPGDTTSLLEIDRATDRVAWRLDMASVHDAVYRAERVDLCDAVPHVRWCPDAAALLAARAADLGIER